MSTNNLLDDSPFKAFLGGNLALPDADIPRLRELLAQPTAELECLDKEVAELERVLEDHIIRRLHLHSSLTRHERIVHPVRRLPNDVLQRIFLFCLPPHPDVPALDQKAVPLLLAQICREWRRVALDTPRLWRGLHIALQAGSRPFVESYMARIDRWLTAAKDERLSLSIWCRDPQTFGELYILEKVILSRSARIQTLKLDSLPVAVLSLFGSLSPDAWPILEKITLKWSKDLYPKQRLAFYAYATALSQIPELDVPGLSIWRAPQLKVAEWVLVDHDILRADLLWDKVEEVQVHRGIDLLPLRWARFDNSRARTMVQSTPNLRRLRIELKEDESSTSEVAHGPAGLLGTKEVLVLPKLTVLNLTVHCPPNAPQVQLLEALQLPALQELKYNWRRASEPLQSERDTSTTPVPTHPHHLVKFLRTQEAPTSIKSFETDVNDLSWEALLECLKLMSALETLWLKQNNQSEEGNFSYGSLRRARRSVDKSVFEALLPSASVEAPSTTNTTAQPMSSGSGCLCPRLTNLRIAFIECELEDVEAFVNARLSLANSPSTLSTPIAPLKHVRMYGNCKYVANTTDVTGQSSWGTPGDPVPAKARALEKELGFRGVHAKLYFSTASESLPWFGTTPTVRKFDPWQGYTESTNEEGPTPDHDWI